MVRALLAGLSIAAAVMAVFAAAASAAPATLATTTSVKKPEQAFGLSFTFAGATRAGADLYAVVRPTGSACAGDFATDQAIAPSPTPSTTLEDGDAEPAGPYSSDAAWTPAAAGTYTVCAWLERTDPDSGITTVVSGPDSTPVTVSGPQVGAVTVTTPEAVVDDEPFPIVYATNTDQPIGLYSVIHAQGAECESSFELDRVENPTAPIIANGTVAAGPVSTTGSATVPTGQYHLCTWLEGPTAGEVDKGPIFTHFHAAKPPAPPKAPKPPKPDPDLAITSLTASTETHQVAYSGSADDDFVGYLTIGAKCTSTHVTQTIAAGSSYSGTLPLPSGCVAGHPIQLAVTFEGSSTYVEGSTTESVDVTAGPPGSHLATAKLPTLSSSSRLYHGKTINVIKVRPHVLNLSTADLGKLTVSWTKWASGRASGHGTLHLAGTREQATATAGAVTDGRFACLKVTRTVSGHQRTAQLAAASLRDHQIKWYRATTLRAHGKAMHLTALLSTDCLG